MTYTEIELELRGIKSVGSIRREIKRLQEFKIIKKLKVEIEGTTFFMYAIRESSYAQQTNKQFK